MTGFEPRIYDIESDRSANWATTTAPNWEFFAAQKWRIHAIHSQREKRIFNPNIFCLETQNF